MFPQLKVDDSFAEEKDGDEKKEKLEVVVDGVGEVTGIGEDGRVAVSLYVAEREDYFRRSFSSEAVDFNAEVGMKIHYQCTKIGEKFSHRYDPIP